MHELVIASTSRAEDAGYVALGDVATATGSMGADYRLVGGHMVGLLVAVYDINAPARDTADADLGAEFAVVGDQRLLDALTTLGYTRPESANRFVRHTLDGLQPTIDVLAPSYTGRHEPNRQHGVLVVDEIPGLALALAQPPVSLRLEAHLTDARVVSMDLLLPGPLPALCLKLLAFGSRLQDKDAFDIWRLLAVCEAAGVGATDWGPIGSQRDAAEVLRRFTATGSPEVRQVTSDRRLQAHIQALAASVGPRR